LTIWNNKISTLPEELYTLTSLKKLTVGKNNISHLSPRIAQLVNLETFESSSSNIRIYPKQMIKLNKLIDLYPNDTMDYIPKALMKYVWGMDTVYRN
jgi:Leucine-rich repeat (LRR) protein